MARIFLKNPFCIQDVQLSYILLSSFVFTCSCFHVDYCGSLHLCLLLSVLVMADVGYVLKINSCALLGYVHSLQLM